MVIIIFYFEICVKFTLSTIISTMKKMKHHNFFMIKMLQLSYYNIFMIKISCLYEKKQYQINLQKMCYTKKTFRHSKI